MNIQAPAYNRILRYLPPRLAVADFFVLKIAQAEIDGTLTASDFEDIPAVVFERCNEGSPHAQQ